MTVVVQADREARFRVLLGYAAGYEISKIDAEQNCSVLAKHAITTALRFSDEECRHRIEASREAQAVLLGEIERLREERDFLLSRARRAGACSLSGERWTGMSSNALVEIAFGGKNDCLPSDGQDLAACYRTMQRLPDHLLSEDLFEQLKLGEAAVAKWSDDNLEWAREATQWDEAAIRARTALKPTSKYGHGSTGNEMGGE